jgi:allantoinase
VVLEDGVVERDLLIRDGRFLAIVEPGEGSAAEEVDAKGLAVLPGAVDAHAHLNEPGRAEWEGWAAGTRGAALGGITTVCDMPLNSIPPTLDVKAFDLKREAAARSAHVDHALWGGLTGATAARLGRLRARGAIGVKAFLVPSGVPEFPHLAVDALVPALRAAAAAGLLVAVHAEDEGLTREATRRQRRRDAAAWLASRPSASEALAIRRLAEAAAETGARVHVVHVSSAAGAREIRRARSRGVGMTGETCPHYLAFSSADVRRAGAVLKCAPPIRGPADRDALWRAVLRGDLDLVASDHSPSPAALKEGDMFSAWGGIAGIQSFLPALLTEGRRRRLSLPRLAWLTATAPARLLGIDRRKGSIRVGADADLAVVDPDRRWVLHARALEARGAASPYVGRHFTAAVVRTIVRGRTVQRDGEIVSGPGWGELVIR